ncbi:MAG: hypothetical protein WC285_00100 [Candidatus Gracilibacteria bacterium]|jgi:hypothetical protein
MGIHKFIAETKLIFREALPADTSSIETRIDSYRIGRERIKDTARTDRETNSESLAKPLETKNPLEIAMDQMFALIAEPEEFKRVFDDMLDKGEVTTSKSDDTEAVTLRVNLELVSPEDMEAFTSLVLDRLQDSEAAKYCAEKLFAKFEDGTWNAYQLGKKSMKAFITYFSDQNDEDKLQKLVNIIAISPTRTSEFIELSQELYSDDTDKQKALLEKLGETSGLKDLIQDWNSRFSLEALSILINLGILQMPDDEAVINNLQLDTKVRLFERKDELLNTDNGRQVQEGLLSGIKENLDSNPADINNLPQALTVYIFNLLLENTAPDSANKELLGKLITNLDQENRKKLATDKRLPKDLRSKIYLSTEKKREDIDDETRLATIEGFKIRGNEIVFNMPPGEQGTERSFRLTRALELMRRIREESTETIDPDILLKKVELAVYQELLNIITDDGSINSNKHKIKDFRESNKELALRIATLNEEIEGREPEIAKVTENANHDLTKSVLGTGEHPSFEVTDEGMVKLGTEITPDQLGTIYDEMANIWRKPPASTTETSDPFPRETFVAANAHLTANAETSIVQGTILTLPFVEQVAPAPETTEVASENTPGKQLEAARRNYEVIKTTIGELIKLPQLKRSADEVRFLPEEETNTDYRYTIKVGTPPRDLVVIFDKNSPSDDLNCVIALSGSNPKFSSWSQQLPILEETLSSVLNSIPNNNPLDTETKIAELARLADMGITFEREPTSLSPSQSIILEKTMSDLRNSFETAADATQIYEQMDEMLFALSRELDGTRIIKFQPNLNINKYLEWVPGSGFGKLEVIVNTILAIKKAQGDQGKYEKFEAQTETILSLRGLSKSENKERYDRRENVNKLWLQTYKMDEKIGALKEEDIRLYWDQFNGHGRVEKAMQSPPFNYENPNVREVAAAIISEDLNDRVYIEDVLPYIRINAKEVFAGEKDLIQQYGNFNELDETIRDINKLSELLSKISHKATALKRSDPSEARKLRILDGKFFRVVLNPCFEVVDAMTAMKFPEGGLDKTETHSSLEVYRDTNTNKGITDNTYKFFNYTEKKTPSNWKKMFAFFDRKTKMSMAVLNGKASDIDEGTFRRFYDPQAALATLFNQLGEDGNPKFYTLDTNGEKVLNEKAIADEIRRLAIKGLQISIGKDVFQTKPSPENLTKTQSLITRLEDLPCNTIEEILTFAKSNPETMLAFQLGFMGDLSDKAEAQKINNIDNLIANSSPQVRLILTELYKSKKLTDEELIQTHHTLVGVGFLAFDQTGGLQAGGIGTSIKINDRLTLSLGIGNSVNGADMGAAITISIIKDGSKELVATVGASIGGGVVRLGYSGIDQIADGITYNIGAGVAGTYLVPPFIIPFVDVGIDWTRRIDVEKRENLKAAKNESLIGELWKKWPEMSYREKSRDVKTLLYAIPGIRANLAYLDTRYQGILSGMPKEEKTRLFINIVDNYIKEKEAKLNEELSPYWIGAVGIGFAYLASTEQREAGKTPCMGLKIYIPGSAFEAFIPHPKERGKLKHLLSQTALDSQINTWLAKGSHEFTEETSDIYYKPGSNLGIGIRTSENETTFSSSGDFITDIGEYNARLKPAEITLKYDSSTKRTEIIIHNTKDRNVELHIDPLLKELGLIVESGKMYLKGNIDNLIITRERFSFPFPFDRTDKAFGKDARQTNLLDIITIRTRTSILGNRNRDTIESIEPAYFEKLPRQKTFTEHPGENVGAVRRSTINFDAIPRDSQERLDLAAQEKDLEAQTPEHMDNQIDDQKLAEFDRASERRYRSLESSDIAEDMTGLTPTMREFFDKTFYKALENDPNGLKTLTDTTDDLALSKLVTEMWEPFADRYNNLNVNNLELKIPTTLTEGQHNEIMNLIYPRWWSLIYPSRKGEKIPENLHKQRTEKISDNIAEYLVLEPGCFITKEIQVKGKGLEHLKIKITNKRDVILVDEEQNVAFYVRDYKIGEENPWETIPADSDAEITGLPKYDKVLKQCTDAVKEQDSETREINKKLAKDIQKRREFTVRKEKGLIDKFPGAIAAIKENYGIKISENPDDIKALVDKFDADIYDNLLAELTKEPPVDFRSLLFSGITQGATLMSASRERNPGEKRPTPTLSRIIGYQTMDPEKGLIHGYGFLEITEVNYENALKYSEEDLKDPEKKKEHDLALILLEIASPGGLKRKIESQDSLIDSTKENNEKKAQEWIDFFSSTFVIRVYGIKALQFISEGTNYDKVTEIVATINDKSLEGEAKFAKIVGTIEANKAALFEFVGFVNELRKAQINKGTCLMENKKTGITVKIDMKVTSIRGGAFTKCTNPSFEVKEDVAVSITSPSIKTRGFAEGTNIVVDSALTKKFANVDLIGAMTFTKSKEPSDEPITPRPTPPKKQTETIQATSTNSSAAASGAGKGEQSAQHPVKNNTGSTLGDNL